MPHYFKLKGFRTITARNWSDVPWGMARSRAPEDPAQEEMPRCGSASAGCCEGLALARRRHVFAARSCFSLYPKTTVFGRQRKHRTQRVSCALSCLTPTPSTSWGSSPHIPRSWLNAADVRTPCKKPTLSANLFQSPTNVAPATPVLSGVFVCVCVCVHAPCACACATFMHTAVCSSSTRTGALVRIARANPWHTCTADPYKVNR
jgi:hypothetical protein